MPDGLDEFAPILLLVNGCLEESSLRVRQDGLTLRLTCCGGVSLSKFRNDVSLALTLTVGWLSFGGGWKAGSAQGKGGQATVVV